MNARPGPPVKEPSRSTRNRRLLLLFTTTGYNTQDFVAAATGLGVEVVFGTDRCHVLDDPWRDAAIPLWFSKPAKAVEAILSYARKYPIHGVVAIGDKPTLTAAFASKALGLRCNAPRAVEACRNKFHSRRILKKAGLPVPDFNCFGIQEDPREIAARIHYPCVLKPLSLSASQGVIRANSRREFKEAFQRITSLLHSPAVLVARDKSNEHILVEDFIEGKEVALEGILTRGKLKTLAVFDKPDPMDGPFFEETLYITPSRLSSEVQEQLLQCAQKAVAALGLTEGPIHAELRVNARGPYILEVACRSIGGLCSRALRFGAGMPLEEIIIRHALAMETEVPPREKPAAGVMMIPIPRSGYLQAVAGLSDASKVSGIDEIAITAKIGQKLVPLPEGSSYLGFIFSRGSTAQFVENALREAHRSLQFEISPSLRVLPVSET
jgi:biotin carboxylase